MCRFRAFARQGVGRTNSGCHILLHLNLCPKTEFLLLCYEKAEQTLPYYLLAINNMEVNLDSKISIFPILLSYLYLLLPILKNNWPKFGQVIVAKLRTRRTRFYSSPAFLSPGAGKGRSCVDPKHIIVILAVLLSPSSAQQWPWHFCFAVWWQQIRAWEFLWVSNCSCSYIPETRTSTMDIVLPCLASVSFLIHVSHGLGPELLLLFDSPSQSFGNARSEHCMLLWLISCQWYQLWNIIGIIMEFGLETAQEDGWWVPHVAVSLQCWFKTSWEYLPWIFCWGRTLKSGSCVMLE